MKAYTDLEQSKKLAEILPIESADMCHKCIGDESYDIIVKPYSEYYEKYKLLVISKDFNAVPCWSLAALIKLLPSEFTTENKFGKYKYEIKIRKYKLTDNVDIYQIAYGNYKWYEDGSHSWKDMINTGQKEELLDVAFDMVCWLKENGNI